MGYYRCQRCGGEQFTRQPEVGHVDGEMIAGAKAVIVLAQKLHEREARNKRLEAELADAKTAYEMEHSSHASTLEELDILRAEVERLTRERDEALVNITREAIRLAENQERPMRLRIDELANEKLIEKTCNDKSRRLLELAVDALNDANSATDLVQEICAHLSPEAGK